MQCVSLLWTLIVVGAAWTPNPKRTRPFLRHPRLNDCPDKCVCNGEAGGYYYYDHINCSNLSLTAVLIGLYYTRGINIDLSFNNITALRNDDYKSFQYTEHISLAYNRINFIEEHAFSSASSLETLDLSHNDIVNISSEIFSSTSNLHTLILAENNHLQLHEKGFQLPNLNHINLSSCGIETIPPQFFHDMPNLHFIVLSDNKLTTFDSSLLLPLVHVNTLDLQSNAFTKMPLGLFNKCLRQTRVDLSGNRLSCDCAMADLDYFKLPQDINVILNCSPSNVTLGEFLNSCKATEPVIPSTTQLMTTSLAPVTAFPTPTTNASQNVNVNTTTTIEHSYEGHPNANIDGNDQLVHHNRTYAWWMFLSIILLGFVLLAALVYVFRRKVNIRVRSMSRSVNNGNIDDEENSVM